MLPVYTRLSDAEENERVRLGMAEPASVRVTGVDDALGDIHLQQRPMSVNDLAAVADLERRAYEAGGDTGHACWTQAMFADEYAQPGRTWWVIHDQGTIVGFAGGMVVDGNLEVLDVAVEYLRVVGRAWPSACSPASAMTRRCWARVPRRSRLPAQTTLRPTRLRHEQVGDRRRARCRAARPRTRRACRATR